jgi:two-component system OmpR family response regulator
MRPAPGTAESTTQRPPGRPLRVVVIDDNRDFVLTTMALLRGEGHETRACYSGSEAYDCVKEFDADVVVLDVGLPGLSGWDVARQLRARIPGKRPLIIGMTGEYAKGADHVLAQIAGFDYYLIKPADPNVLLALVEKANSRPNPA